MTDELRERLVWASMIVVGAHVTLWVYHASGEDARYVIRAVLLLLDIPATVVLWLNIAWPWLNKRDR